MGNTVTGRRRSVFDNVDYVKLQRQRALLRHVAGEFRDKEMKPEAEAIQGLICLLDDFVDYAAKRLGKEKVFGKESKNSNCLRNMRCPNCANENGFLVEVVTSINMYDDGTGDPGDTDWGAMSYVQCHHCGLGGRAWQFQI